MPKHKILVAGASGLVGYAAVRHFSQLPDWDVVAVSRRAPENQEGASFISVDLTDTARCAEVFSHMSDVTHVVYAAVNEKPGLIEGWRDKQQMQLNRSMLVNLFEPLEKVAKDLQHVCVLQGTKAYGAHVEPFPVPARERWPRHPHDNFYWLHEDYIKEKQQGKNWHWSIWRPQLVFGEAIGGNLNVITALGVYAAVLKEQGQPLFYPGGPPYVFEAIDVDVMAHAFEWAASADTSHNEIFNITNGDVFVWENVWPVLAEAFGMQVGPPKPFSLAQELPKQQAAWEAIVQKYNLTCPASVQAFVGESAALADFCLAYGRDQPPPPMLVSTIKLRQAGFHECMDTEDMFRKWIKRFQELRWLPPVGR